MNKDRSRKDAVSQLEDLGPLGGQGDLKSPLVPRSDLTELCWHLGTANRRPLASWPRVDDVLEIGLRRKSVLLYSACRYLSRCHFPGERTRVVSHHAIAEYVVPKSMDTMIRRSLAALAAILLI